MITKRWRGHSLKGGIIISTVTVSLFTYSSIPFDKYGIDLIT